MSEITRPGRLEVAPELREASQARLQQAQQTLEQGLRLEPMDPAQVGRLQGFHAGVLDDIRGLREGERSTLPSLPPLDDPAAAAQASSKSDAAQSESGELDVPVQMQGHTQYVRCSYHRNGGFRGAQGGGQQPVYSVSLSAHEGVNRSLVGNLLVKVAPGSDLRAGLRQIASDWFLNSQGKSDEELSRQPTHYSISGQGDKLRVGSSWEEGTHQGGRPTRLGTFHPHRQGD
ncbi:MAG: hypothetical protein HY319_29435 [Armatimonadetes bacterium]|nr:hypothetical protein [Armatimonadota bacterium]